VDGWFTLPYSVPNYLAPLLGTDPLTPDSAPVQEALARTRARVDRLLTVGGSHGPSHFHRILGDLLYEGCGVTRTEPSLTATIAAVRQLREQFWSDLRIVGSAERLNQELERAGRVADYLELAELMCVDALDREESCGAHFRDEHQVDGEAARDDEHWAFASAWQVDDGHFVRHHEPLTFESVRLQTRNYA
ncbi:MAG: fumarate reductase/succinate dehydrogenase flavoprotein subunit, partial [Terracoccus sp.]